ncbi:hypothetical protein [Sulfurovum mangrovi]|uniref:hypothetical protein n=1 Tax=Sulfurovum mangrovi TaxID=2893889 RepID=UPI001E49DA89|nr:hypothetical protein [Sulfurovum mangrovi]UFH59776.1 hypothetical protein LN246_02770 [Sulfurovum mangrovi]UFH60576.1 hypothetical protein LN246_13395 [Sulfurovum mangrovi]
MQISVDISLYPLKEIGYEQPILDFIAALEKEPSVDIVRNELSTQLHGDYAIIMKLLQEEIYAVFEELPDSVFVLKLVGNNRKGIY